MDSNISKPFSGLKFPQKAVSYRKFNWIAIAIAFTPVVSLGLINLAVDPYGVINTPTISNFNKFKPERITRERMYKAVEITRLKPQIILLGSSRTQWGLDPQHPSLAKTDLKAYNLGFSGANMYEIMRYFKHAIANQPDLKTVVIGLDFFMFRENNPPQADFLESRLERTSINPQDLINALFSLDALSASQKTISKNIDLSYPNYQISNGLFLPDERNPLPGSSQEFAKWIKPAFSAYGNYKISPESLNQLQEIIKICQEKGLDVKVFISPSHAIEGEAIKMVGSWQKFEQWKRELVKITPVWDFSGYNSITGEVIRNQMKNYIDNSHYRQEVGDLILSRIFNHNQEQIPNDFGRLLTTKNIETNLENIRIERKNWVKSNLNDVKLVENIKLKFDAKTQK